MVSRDAEKLTLSGGGEIRLFDRALRGIKTTLRPVKASFLHAGRVVEGLAYHRLEKSLDHSNHIEAAICWLERAQDFGTDDGVSYGARLSGGLQESYPEVTGYVITTFLDLATRYGRREALERAIAMGDWEIAVQMDSGAVMGGKITADPTPAVFNTGQVLLGWAALYRLTGERRFLEAAKRASTWLIAHQEPDGAWIRGNSRFARADATLYNVKAAWGLCEAGFAGVGQEAIDAAVRNADYCISRQHANGWFPDCCLNDPNAPLLHTIAYSMQGLIGIGLATREQKYIRHAELTARSLMRVMRDDGYIPGRLDSNFKARSTWCCLTGTAQTSIVWSQLFAITGNPDYSAARRRANAYLMQRHHLTTTNAAVRGAVYGAWPVWGEYGQLMVMSWPTKFFVDALLLEVEQDQISIDIGGST